VASKNDPYKRYDDRAGLVELLDAFLDEKEFDKDGAVRFCTYSDGSMLIFDISGIPALLRDASTGKVYQQKADRLSAYLLKPYRELKRSKGIDNWRSYETIMPESFFDDWITEREMKLEFSNQVVNDTGD